MREILFRGKREDNGRWVEGGYYYDAQGCHIISEPIFEHPTFSDPCGNYYNKNHEVISETIDQFTGLLDKNGKKIFEGDRVKVTTQICGNFVDNRIKDYLVIFKGFCFCLKSDSDFYTLSLIMGSNQIIEVIGNIHEEE